MANFTFVGFAFFLPAKKDFRIGKSFFVYKENHSLGEWFQKRLMPKDVQRKPPFARIRVRSANCTKKQREVIQNERRK